LQRTVRLVEADGRRVVAELDFGPMPGRWDEVASDHGNCMGRSCPMYFKCFYYRARRRMQNAQILVVNHALFFHRTGAAGARTSASCQSTTPVIFDEAHQIESVAGDHLGLSISSGQIEFTLRKLYNERTNRGLLVHHKLTDAQKEVWECRDRAADFLDSVARWLDETAGRQWAGSAAEHHRQPVERKVAKTGRHACAAHAIEIESAEQRQDFIAAANRLESLAKGHRRLAGPADSRVGLLDRSNLQPSRPRITLEAAPIVRGARPARASVRQSCRRSSMTQRPPWPPAAAIRRSSSFSSRVGLKCTPHHAVCGFIRTRSCASTEQENSSDPFFQTQTLWPAARSTTGIKPN